MGIDAEMFVRLRRRPEVTSEEVREASYWLASTLGHDHFFISEEHHVLELIKPQSAEDRWRDSTYDGKICWHQDGLTLVAEEGEQFVRVHLWSRYYGEGYERGNWMLLRTVVEWLKRRWPDGAVWYGGDSGGVCAEELTSARLEKLDRLYFCKGREAYTHFSLRGSSHVWCLTCEHEMANIGGGGADNYLFCHGCGQEVIETPHGLFGPAERGEQVFALHDKVRKGLAARATKAEKRG